MVAHSSGPIFRSSSDMRPGLFSTQKMHLDLMTGGHMVIKPLSRKRSGQNLSYAHYLSELHTTIQHLKDISPPNGVTDSKQANWNKNINASSKEQIQSYRDHPTHEMLLMQPLVANGVTDNSR